MVDGRLVLDSFDVYIQRNKSRILSARNNLFFKIVFRPNISKMYRFEKRRNFSFPNSFVKL